MKRFLSAVLAIIMALTIIPMSEIMEAVPTASAASYALTQVRKEIYNRNYAFRLYSDLYNGIKNSNLFDAVFKLGLCYWNGHGCKQNEKKAGRLFKEAVEKCPEIGEYWFYWGLYYKKENADPNDIKKAFQNAFERGYKPAKDYLE